MLFHIVALFFLILTNGMLSLIEIAMVSARPSLLRQMEQEGKWGATRAIAILEDPNVFLSTAQIGITLVGILSGAYGGIMLKEPLEVFLKGFPIFEKYAEVVALPAIIASVTYISLVAGELVPKRLALQFAEKISCTAAPPMHLLSIILKPLVWFLDFSGDVILRPFNLHENIKRPVTAEELQQMAKQGHKEGSIEKDELTMVKRVFNLSDRNIASVMTPRLLVEWLKLDMSKDELRGIIMLSEFSQFPVAEESLENPIGTVNAHDLLCQLAAGGEFNIQAMMKPPLFLPESVNAMDALRKMQKMKDPMALVIDQYGVCSGIVTPEDITSVLVAESELPFLSEDNLKMQSSAWVADGLTDIHTIMEKFSFTELPGKEPDSYHTLGGMAMTVLNKIPQAGDVFVWENLRFQVLSMNGQRVNKVKISQISDAQVHT
ncbi:MAG: hemolysin family protein [Fibromonadaceae bacterium]|jgi:putative hemolysin|nr:hemolysin family protein [Fibromonadaceae bacterium]